MITTDMRYCNVYGTKIDGYGSSTLDLTTVKNVVKMAVYVTDYSSQINTVFAGSSYVGLTLDKKPDDTWIGDLVDVGQKYFLKITFVYTKGRYTQIFMQDTKTATPS